MTRVLVVFILLLLSGCTGMQLSRDGAMQGPSVQPFFCQSGMRGECHGEGNDRKCHCVAETIKGPQKVELRP